MRTILETSLYRPVKVFLEGLIASKVQTFLDATPLAKEKMIAA